ncbi:hypothetical protein C1645_743400 [Glomus cerebriforme]|uniref:Uncharacterized protein n=1 Tax=Glomus cerebriforme TaxID=658196 RepID=A0A397SE40_9GLOM|nr:hypothetical protein C1645_743400 [Glomus cerebriforme]
MQISIDCDNNEVEDFFENYIKQKEHEFDHNRASESKVDKENESPNEQETLSRVNNPVVNNCTKGRPAKKVRFKNIVKSFKDKSNVKSWMYQNCKKYGEHNLRTCIKSCENYGNLSYRIHQCKN